MFSVNRLQWIFRRKSNRAILSTLIFCSILIWPMSVQVANGAISGDIPASSDSASIAGRITNSAGRPLAWISVVHYRLDDAGEFVKLGDEVFGVKTNTNGEYRIDSLHPGTYRIHFVDTNYILNTDENPTPDTGLVYVSEFYVDAPDLAAATDITLDLAQEQEGIDAELARAMPPGAEGEAEVTNCATFGSVSEVGTLADALATANVINFACSGTIIVPEIPVTSDLILNGIEGVSLSGNGANRVLRVFPGIEAEVNDLTITKGSGYIFGGAIYNTASQRRRLWR